MPIVKVTVTCEMGTFVSDEKEEDASAIDDAKRFFENIDDVKFLSIQKNGTTIYFPKDIVRRSVISLTVSD